MEVYLQTAAVILYYPLSPSFINLIAPNILKTFLSKAAIYLAISSLNVQDSVSYVATGLIKILHIFVFSVVSTDWIFSRGRHA